MINSNTLDKLFLHPVVTDVCVPPGFVCHWRECGLDALGEFVELVRHVYFHAFHVKIKSIGMSLILKNQLRGCLLESVSRNMIPELPDQLQCGWVSCEVSNTIDSLT